VRKQLVWRKPAALWAFLAWLIAGPITVISGFAFAGELPSPFNDVDQNLWSMPESMMVVVGGAPSLGAGVAMLTWIGRRMTLSLLCWSLVLWIFLLSSAWVVVIALFAGFGGFSGVLAIGWTIAGAMALIALLAVRLVAFEYRSAAPVEPAQVPTP
jgi:hypothetical protein